MKKKQTIYAFIDSQNLNLGIRSLKWRLDYGKFRLYLRNKYNVTKALLFIGFIPGNSLLYQNLQEQGFILVFKNVLAIKKDDKVTYKGNVDAELVLHSMIHYNDYEKAIIVSGDGDFFCLVEHLAKENKLEKIIVPNTKYSSLLKGYAQYIISLSTKKGSLGLKQETFLKPKEKRHSRGNQG